MLVLENSNKKSKEKQQNYTFNKISTKAKNIDVQVCAD